MNPAHTTIDPVEETAARWVQAKAERALSDQETEDLALWLAQSERHASAFERLGRAWASPTVWTALANLAEAERRPAPRFKLRPSSWAGIGAAAAVAAVAAVFAGPRFEQAAPVRTEYQTRTAELRTITLADGSRIHLNGETAIGVRFDRLTRRIDLKAGEFLIEVAPEQRTLQVWADGARVSAVGTAFNIDRRQDGLSVVVTEGVVEITREAWSPVRVPAGKAARITSAGVAVSAPDPFSTAWREGALATSGVSIADLAHALSRYTDREIIVSPHIANEMVSGRFSLTQPDRTLRLLAAAYDIELREEPNRFVLSQAGP